MKLRKLRVRRMPGIDDGFSLDDLADGPNLIVGPNGAGKTTLCRAYRAALWPSTETGAGIAVEVQLQDGPGRWIVRREEARVGWQRDGVEADPPSLPSPNAARCFTLGFRDLLSGEHPTDETVAQEIRRQMAGGFDVRQVVESEFALRQRHGLAEDARLRDCMREIVRVRGEQSDLADREERLRDLENELRQAQAAAARSESLKTAAALRRSRDELDSIRRRLREFPGGVARLEGDEQRRIEELDADVESVGVELAGCRAEIDNAEAAEAAARLTGGPVDETVLNGWAARVRRLEQRAAELATARRRAGQARAKRDEAARGLASHGPAKLDEPVVDEGTLRAVESLLERAAQIRSERARLDSERNALSGKRPATPSRDLDQAVRCLSAWQAARAMRPAALARRWFSILGAVLLAAAPVAWWFGAGPAAVALAAAGIVTLLILLSTGAFGRHGADADASRRDFERLGIEPPASWEPDSVRDRLGLLQRQWAEAAYRERELQRLEELEPADAELRKREQALASDRQALRQRIGIDPGLGDLDVARVARALSAYQAATIEYHEAEASREQTEREQAELLAGIASFATAHGAAAPANEFDAAAVIDDIRDRSRALRDALERRRREESRCENLERRLAELRRQREAIFTGVGLEPDDRATLKDWLERRETHRSLTLDAEQRRRTIVDLEEQLSDRPELVDLPAEEIGRRILEADALAARQTGLIEERARTRDAVERARRGQALEAAAARAAEARSALEVRRDEALFKRAGQFLLDDVTSQFDRQSRPEILARAADLFERFTHHRYELRIDAAGEQPQFRAVEADSGAGKSLAQLSDATRVQLLLAARVAFALQADREAGLPLFLDEVLTTTDPERFVAVAESLLVLVRDEGRQVFYLTANPSDVAQWNRVLRSSGQDPVVPIDLASLRGLAAGVAAQGDLEVPPLPEVPSPAGMDAERYGVLLEVPRVDLHRPPTALHLFHLLRDDLDLLQFLLTRRIRTVGQWRRLAAGEDGATLVGRDAALRISALADVAEEFFAAWRIGRSRPIDTAVLRDAGLSEVWIEKLESLLEELGGDPARLLDALQQREDDRAKGFRSRVRERLREYLIEQGYLDEREPLDEAAIHSRVQGAVAVHVDTGLIGAETVAARVHELHHQGGGVPRSLSE